MKQLLALLSILSVFGCTECPAQVAKRAPDPDKVVARRFGWRSNPHHSRGLMQIVHNPLFGTAPLPSSATVRDRFYPDNQDTDGACTGFTGVEILDAGFMKQTGSFVHPSFMDFYQQELQHDGNYPNDAGSYTATMLWVATQSKVCLESAFPYVAGNLGILPPQLAVSGRKFYAIKAYDVPNDDGGTAVRNCIATIQIPVAIGIYWYNNWFTPTKDLATGKYYIGVHQGSPVGGHEIPIISYDDNLTINGIKGWVEFHNHWVNADGSPWGDNDTCWAPESEFLNPQIAEDFGAVEVVAVPTSATR